MTKIQVILLSCLLFIVIAYFARFRRAAVDKLLVCLMALTGMWFIIFPEITNRLAHFLGIGRGADLIFYLAILAFAYLVLVLYAKIKKLEDQITMIVRKETLDSFHPGEINK